MKLLVTLALAAAFASAIPIDAVSESDSHLLTARAYTGGDTSTQLDDGSSAACPKVILIFARASTESGNLVNIQFDTTEQLANPSRVKAPVQLLPVRLCLIMAGPISGSRALEARTRPP
jgi:hypothetical protein